MSDLDKLSSNPVREIDPLLRDLNEKKQNFRRNVVSLAAELKEVRTRLSSQEQSYAKESLTRQEAETKAKIMEHEIGKLQTELEERNEQLKASASTSTKIFVILRKFIKRHTTSRAQSSWMCFFPILFFFFILLWSPGEESGKYLYELDGLRLQLAATQATADASAASAQSAQNQCLMLLKELDEKNISLKEHEDRVIRLGEQLDNLQKDLQARESSQKQLKDEVMRVEHDIMEALAKSGANKDCELRKLLDEVSPKNFEKINRLLIAKDEEITKLKDEIRMMSAHWKLKTKELESQLEKQRRADQELKKRVLKLEFCLQEARAQTRKLQRIGERREKAIKDLRDQLAAKQGGAGAADVEKQNFWESSGFKIVVSMSMLILVVFSKR